MNGKIDLDTASDYPLLPQSWFSDCLDTKDMLGYVDRAADQVADILMRDGLDYTQTKALFRKARPKTGLSALKRHRGSPARLTLEVETRFIDQAYAPSGQVGLMMQVLLETDARVSEFVPRRVEDVSLGERTIVMEDGGGGKRREVPMRTELTRLVALHVGRSRSGPLLVDRRRPDDGLPPTFAGQPISQIVLQMAHGAGIGRRTYPHLLRHTMAT